MRIIDTADGSCTLYSERYAQTFHSRHGAARESRHVFLDATGSAAPLLAGHPLRVLEVGFGSGLNALLTADAARRGGAALHYTALEQELLPATWLRPLGHAALLQHAGLAEILYAGIDSGIDGRAARLQIELAPGIGVEILRGDARDARLTAAHYDAVYLDAFSPDSNPELWGEDFLAALFAALRPGGRLATYSAKGSVRRALLAVGFAARRLPGPPGKREMLLATRPA